MDNFKIDIRGDFDCDFPNGPNTKPLIHALAYLESCGRICATHFEVREQQGEIPVQLIFYWTDPKIQNAQKLPFPIKTVDAMKSFLLQWLQHYLEDHNERKTFGMWCDHDGSDGHGWRIYTESWGHAGGSFYGSFAFHPMYCWYGK